jgi:hypothetical protein
VRATVMPPLQTLGIALATAAFQAAPGMTGDVPSLVENMALRPAVGVSPVALGARRERVSLGDPVVAPNVPVALGNIGQVYSDDEPGGHVKLSDEMLLESTPISTPSPTRAEAAAPISSAVRIRSGSQ